MVFPQMPLLLWSCQLTRIIVNPRSVPHQQTLIKHKKRVKSAFAGPTKDTPRLVVAHFNVNVYHFLLSVCLFILSSTCLIVRTNVSLS